MFDISGKVVFNKNVELQNNDLQIPFEGYASGVYILKLDVENAKPLKIIKQ